MIYTAKEAFLTIQGEGGQAAGGLRASPAAIGGTVSSGIALAICAFCDTAFVGVDGAGRGQVNDRPGPDPPHRNYVAGRAVSRNWSSSGQFLACCVDHHVPMGRVIDLVVHRVFPGAASFAACRSSAPDAALASATARRPGQSYKNYSTGLLGKRSSVAL